MDLRRRDIPPALTTDGWRSAAKNSTTGNLAANVLAPMLDRIVEAVGENLVGKDQANQQPNHQPHDEFTHGFPAFRIPQAILGPSNRQNDGHSA
jgi:hypothetical protein